MKQTNKYIIKIYLTILFILSQTFAWELISHFISETSGFYKTYPAFQIMFAYIYILSCVFFTRDNKKFISFWKEHPLIYRIFDIILDISARLIEIVMRIGIIIPELISTDRSTTEIQLQKKEITTNVKKYKKFSLQARCVLPIAVIMIFSIPLFEFGEKTFLHYYSQIMNLIAEYSCAMKSHFRKSGNQMSVKWKSSYASLLA